MIVPEIPLTTYGEDCYRKILPDVISINDGLRIVPVVPTCMVPNFVEIIIEPPMVVCIEIIKEMD